MNIQSISHTETKLKVDSRNVDLKSVTEKKQIEKKRLETTDQKIFTTSNMNLPTNQCTYLAVFTTCCLFPLSMHRLLRTNSFPLTCST